MSEKDTKKNLFFNEKFNKYQNNNTYSEIKNTKSVRYHLLDNLKGFLIFTVVFAHFLLEYSYGHKNSISYSIVNYIYCFHMPAFIFCSGFLSKSINSQSVKNISKMLLIYFIFNFSHGLILYFYDNSKIKLVEPYHSYWYLICLIYWRLIINYFSGQCFSITISFIISLMIGFIDEINTSFSLKKSLAFFPYFLIGYKIPKNYLELIIKFGNNYFIYIFLTFVIFVASSFNFISKIEIHHSMLSNNYYILLIINQK